MPSRHRRVTRGDDYRRIVRSGNRVGGALCIAYAVSRFDEVTGDPAPARFGYIVSKAVGGAVTRNLVRRRMKTVSERLIAEGLDGVDLVFRALPAAADASFGDLERELRRTVERALSRMRST